MLATFVQPSGGVIAGQGCVIGLDGWVPLEMVVLDKAGLVVNIPRYVSPNAEGRGRPRRRQHRRSPAANAAIGDAKPRPARRQSSRQGPGPLARPVTPGPRSASTSRQPPETQDSSDSAEYQPELRTAVPPPRQRADPRGAGQRRPLPAFVQPSGGVISGQGCVIGLDGWVPIEMVVLDRAGLVVNIPRYVSPNAEAPRRGSPRRPAAGPDADPNARKDRLEAIRERVPQGPGLRQGRRRRPRPQGPGPVARPQAGGPAALRQGEKPVIFRAEGRVEILDALKIAADLKLKAVISGGAEAWKVADALKAAKVPVLVGGTLRLPTEATDPYDAAYANPARLHEAGVTFAIKSGGSDVGTASRNLPYDAAMAVAYGLPEAVALRAVTLAPAEILGVADQLGSLEVGKRANLVITAGHVLQPTTEVKGLFLAGKPLPPESRHTRLYAKYQGRLAEVKAGTAPLGIDTDPGQLRRPPPPTPAPASGGPARPEVMRIPESPCIRDSPSRPDGSRADSSRGGHSRPPPRNPS